MGMCNSDDLDLVAAHAVDQSVRVSSKLKESVLIITQRVGFGILGYAGYSRVECRYEAPRRLLAARFILGQRLDEFEIGRRRQADISHRRGSPAIASLPPTGSA